MKRSEKDAQKVKLLVGMTIAFGLSLCALEYAKPFEQMRYDYVGEVTDRWVEEDIVPVTLRLPKPPARPTGGPPTPLPKPPVILAIVDNDLPEKKDLPEYDFSDVDVYEPIDHIEPPAINPLDFPDEYPVFPGGDAALFKFLNERIRYPAFAKSNGIEGTVHVKFTVGADGKVRSEDIEILRSPHRVLSEEAIRVIVQMPYWKPGRQNLRNVPVYMKLPINFELE